MIYHLSSNFRDEFDTALISPNSMGYETFKVNFSIFFLHSVLKIHISKGFPLLQG